MPPPRHRVLLIALAALAAASLFALLLPRPAGAAPPWRWPVRGPLVGRFAYARAAPFTAGARRGIDIAASPGAAARSACRGRVTFAGEVPGGRGLGVTVRCGALVATHLGLTRLAVRRGARVAAGTRLGRVGPTGTVRLGARRAADRFGYVDPLPLLRGDAPGGGPAMPVPAARRGPRLPVAPRPAAEPVPLGQAPHAAAERRPPLGRPARAPGLNAPAAPSGPRDASPRAASPLARRPPAATSPGAAIPAGAWAGLVLLAAGVPVGGVVRRRRARSAAAAAAPATTAGR